MARLWRPSGTLDHYLWKRLPIETVAGINSLADVRANERIAALVEDHALKSTSTDISEDRIPSEITRDTELPTDVVIEVENGVLSVDLTMTGGDASGSVTLPVDDDPGTFEALGPTQVTYENNGARIVLDGYGTEVEVVGSVKAFQYRGAFTAGGNGAHRILQWGGRE